MQEISGADAIVDSLIANDVQTVFGLPGGQLDHFFDSIFRSDGKIQLLHSRHEQGAAYMAFGYAQSTGKVGVYAVVPGPGLLNSAAALCTAWACNSPVLAISGQVHLEGIDSGYGHLHEIPDQLGMISHITKWAQRIETPSDTPDVMDMAFQTLQSGRPRPVEIEMPMDTMGQMETVRPAEKTRIPDPPAVDTDQIDAAVDLLLAAENPMIVIGSGALDAADELLILAERIQAPVVAKRKGKGIVPSDHYLSQNLPAGHRLWEKTDVVLAVGTRLKMPLTMWGKDDHLKLIRVDIDAEEISRICEPEIGILGDAKSVLSAMASKLDVLGGVGSSREEELNELKASIDQDMKKHVGPQMAYLEAIRTVLPRDGFFVDEVTQVGFASWYGFPVYRPRQFITAAQQGTLGFGLATALGVAAAHPDKAVVSISGDGGYLFNIQELATAAKYQLGLVSVVFNDHKFTNVQRQQDEWFDGRRICSDLTNPDFMKLADSFGIRAYRVDSPNGLRSKLDTAFAQSGPTLIEVTVTERFPSPWRYILMQQNRGSVCP